MIRVVLSRALSVLLIAVMSVATNAPLLDGILFHGRNGSEVVTPHYASSSCHAERCAIQYTARDSRPSPVVLIPVRVLAVDEPGPQHPPPSPPLPSGHPEQNQPRAPPSGV